MARGRICLPKEFRLCWFIYQPIITMFRLVIREYRMDSLKNIGRDGIKGNKVNTENTMTTMRKDSPGGNRTERRW